jgi:uncharacterized OB-fold protein
VKTPPAVVALTPTPYIDHFAEGGPVLLASRCLNCTQVTFPPASVCPRCISLDVEPHALPREGTLYSYTLSMLSPYGQPLPVIIGFVDLLDGTRVLSQIVADPNTIACDVPVHLVSSEPIRTPNGVEVLDFRFAPMHP